MQSEIERLTAENARLKKRNSELQKILFAFHFDMKNSVYTVYSAAELLKNNPNSLDLKEEDRDTIVDIILNATEKQRDYFDYLSDSKKLIRRDAE